MEKFVDGNDALAREDRKANELDLQYTVDGAGK